MFGPYLAKLPAQQMNFAGALQVIVQHEDIIYKAAVRTRGASVQVLPTRI